MLRTFSKKNVGISLKIVKQIHTSKIIYNKSTDTIDKANVTEQKPQEKVLSPEEKKKQAAQLAIQSLKDIGAIFSLGSQSDSETQPINTSPIYANPAKFPHLNMLHQGQVLKELEEKMIDKWELLTPEEKKLSYYIAYGNWGAREGFENWNQQSAPLDLPFALPSVAVNKSSGDVVKKLPEVNLYELSVRKKEFDFNRLDGLTRFLMYLVVSIAALAVYRDIKVGESGRPVNYTIPEFDFEEIDRKRREDQLLKEDELKAEKLNKTQTLEASEKSKSRKWYYLYLK